MRATGNGPLGALLMLAPLVAIPILAVVGIPQFAGGNLIDSNGARAESRSRTDREPVEPRLGSSARHDADDLFAPLGDAGDINEFDDPLSRPRKPSKRGHDQDDELAFQDESPRRDNSRRFNQGSTRGDELDESDAKPFDAGDTGGFDENLTDEPADQFLKKASKQKIRQTSGLNGSAEEFDSEASRTSPHRSQPRDLGTSDALLEGQNGDSQSNPFEATAPAKPRTSSSRLSNAKSAARDPNDAPAFAPSSPAVNAEEEIAGPLDSPASKSTGTRNRTSPRISPDDVQEAVPPQQKAGQPAKSKLDELSWQTATKKLRALGVGPSKQYFVYLEDRDVFLFKCQAIHNQDATKSQRFEAEADDPLLAVRYVLDKLESWQHPTKRRTRIVDENL